MLTSNALNRRRGRCWPLRASTTLPLVMVAVVIANDSGFPAPAAPPLSLHLLFKKFFKIFLTIVIVLKIKKKREEKLMGHKWKTKN